MASELTEAARDDLLPPRRKARGHDVGPSSCRLIESTFDFEGRSYRRFDVGLDGTVDGFVTKAGPYKYYLTNAPDLMFPQSGNPNPRFFAVAPYERDMGAAFILVLPGESGDWNGKAFVTAHGRGRSFARGQLKPWNRYRDPADPVADLNRYDRAVIAKGFALVKTWRTSHEGLGEITALLEDGSTSDEASFNDSAAYIADFTAVARRLISEVAGRAPARTYLYGHSAGARIARGMNYAAGGNIGADGRRIFDGFLADDAAAGTWLPVLMKDGVDVLLAREADRAAFVPQLEVGHQLYNAVWDFPARPDYLTDSFLENKRRNAAMLIEKGLGDRFRYYEVRGVSHRGGEAFAYGAQNPPILTLDLPLLMGRFVDLLDQWADKGRAPPPNRSDCAPLGDPAADGVLRAPAISLPELSCPLGVYHPFPKDGAYDTGFAPFDGKGLEPRDEAGAFIDMNRNGVWDRRETIEEAWVRLGLLAPGERFSRALYVARMTEAAETLRTQGFFDDAAVATTIARAREAELFGAG
jgi:hypothetical protein